MNAWFRQMVAEGTDKPFAMAHKEHWLQHTRPMFEALFHAHHFVSMACRQGKEPVTPSVASARGQATLLGLFDLSPTSVLTG